MQCCHRGYVSVSLFFSFFLRILIAHIIDAATSRNAIHQARNSLDLVVLIFIAYSCKLRSS